MFEYIMLKRKAEGFLKAGHCMKKIVDKIGLWSDRGELRIWI